MYPLHTFVTGMLTMGSSRKEYTWLVAPRDCACSRADVRRGKLSHWKSKRKPKYLLKLRATPAPAIPPPPRTNLVVSPLGRLTPPPGVYVQILSSSTFPPHKGRIASDVAS